MTDDVEALRRINQLQSAPDRADGAYLALAAAERTHIGVFDRSRAEYHEYADESGAKHVIEVVR
jgi:hypothetical protein